MYKTQKIYEDRPAEHGNVLIMILVAVILFGALGFTVSNIMRSGDPTMIADQKAYIAATEILDYAQTIRDTVHDLRINGCTDTEISFENSALSGYVNPNAPADGSCHVFAPDGGGAAYIEPVDDWLDSSWSSVWSGFNYGKIQFYGNTCLQKENVISSTSCRTNGIDDEDLVLFIPFLNKRICEQVNRLVNIPKISGEVPNDTGCAFSGSGFTGTYTEAYDIYHTKGKMSGCFRYTGCGGVDDSYLFYQVLINR